MFLSRPVLLVSSFALLWGVHLSAQTVPVQSRSNAQQRIQQPPIQWQPMQAQPMQAPLFGTQNATKPQPTAQPAGQNAPGYTQPVLRVASTNSTALPVGQPISLYDGSGTNQIPQIIQPPPAQGIPPGMVHIGRAEPENRIVPFFLNPAEQQELDDFLVRWEKYSAGIRRYDVEFDVLEYDSLPQEGIPNKPFRVSYGHFKYIANPKRFLFVIEGEFRDGKYVKRDGDKNPQINAEKIIIDERTVSKYDFNAKTVHQINVPPEMIGKGIAESPLPLIFGAKADELKRRFSMKVVTEQNGITRLYARPLLIEDQQEFKELEVLLGKDLRAQGLRQWDINGKAHKVYALKSTKINDQLDKIVGDIKSFFTPETPVGWKKEVHDWVLQQPPPAPAMPQPQIAHPPQEYRNETLLYRVQ